MTEIIPGSTWLRRYQRPHRAFPVQVLAVVPITDAPIRVKGYDPDLTLRWRGQELPKPATAVVFRAAWRPRLRYLWAWLTRRRFCVTEERFRFMYEPMGGARIDNSNLNALLRRMEEQGRAGRGGADAR
jgi:hypothetical protein